MSIRGNKPGIGAYELEAPLGHGGFGSVYRVRHVVTGAQRALKRLKRDATPAHIKALKAEFALLAEAAHPNLVAVDEIFFSGTHWAYTMEFVDGHSIHLLPDSLSWERLYPLLVQALSALGVLHDRGYIHGDLRPENLLVRPSIGGQEERLTLIDLGLARSAGSATWVGSPQWAAPELLAGDVGGLASDLYSLGSVFYNLLAGAHPFPEESISALIEAKLTSPPPNLREVMPSIPIEVAAFLQRLMATEASERPQGAWEALQGLKELGGEGGGAGIATMPGLTLVERGDPLAALRRACGSDGASLLPNVHLIFGRAGAGRTRFLETLAQSLGSQGLATTCITGGWSGAHLEVVRHLVSPALWKDRTRGRHLAGRYPMAMSFLGLGDGQRTSRSEGAPGLDNTRDDAAVGQDPIDLMEDLVSLIVASHGGGSRRILIDDVHDLDGGSLDILRRLAPRLSEKGRGKLGLVLSLEEGAIKGRDDVRLLLEGLDEEDIIGERVQLDPLSQEGVRELLAGTFGSIQGGEGLPEVLHRSSGGNPLILSGLLEELIEGGGLFRPGRSWALDPDIVAAQTSHHQGDLGLFFARRLGGLGEAERRLLELAAVLGSDLTPGALVALGEMGGAEDVIGTLGRVVDRKLLLPLGGRLQLNPPRLGEWLIASLPSAQLCALRGGVGAYLLASEVALELSAKARVAEHLLAADAPQGIELATEVAGQWQRSLIFDPARRLLRKALGVAERRGESSQVLRRQLAQCARRLGDFAEAAHALEGLCGAYRGVTSDSDLTSRRDAASYYLELGEVFGRAGRWRDGARVLEKARLLLGEDILPEEVLVLARERSLLRRYQGDARGAEEILLSALESQGLIPQRCSPLGGAGLGQVPEVFPGTKELPLTLILEICQNLGAASYLQGQMPRCEGWLRAGLTLAGSDFPSGEVQRGPLGEATANLLMLLSSVLQARGALDDAGRAAQQAIRFYELTGRSQAAARCYNNFAMVCISQGNWQEAIELWERFRRVCDRSRTSTDLASVLNNLGEAYREYGRLSQARRRLEQALELGKRAGYRKVVGLVLGNLGEVSFREQAYQESFTFYTEALAIAREVKARDLEVETLRRLVEWREANRESGIVAKALDALALAREVGLPREEGTLLGCLGLAKCKGGRQEEGRRYFTVGEEVLAQAKAPLEGARLKVRKAMAHFFLGEWDAADREIGEAKRRFEELGAQWDLENVRQVTEEIDRNSPLGGSSRKSLQLLLDVNQTLSQVLDIESLLGEILSQGLRVTGARRGFIILFDEQGNPTFRAARHMGEEEVGGDSERVSSTVVREVMETKQAKAVTDIEEDQALKNQQSIVSLGLGSVMAAPMVRHGKLNGIIYVDSPYAASQMFLTQHLRLFEALADSAAVAVENATLYEDLRRKTDLMYIMAHEFRTPLTGVLSFADLLLDDESLSDEQEKFLRIIREAGRRLSGMVSSVLDLAKMEANKAEWAMEGLDVGLVAREALRTLGPLAKERGLEVKVVEVGSPLPMVYGNVDRLIQVLTNLLSNAFKFTPVGGTITIRIEEAAIHKENDSGLRVSRPEGWSRRTWVVGRTLSESQCVQVSVEDSGRGIEPGALESIFDKFAQEGPRSDQRKGTGLGLAIAKEIVEYHGGQIWAENRPEGGSAFRFYIPLSTNDVADP